LLLTGDALPRYVATFLRTSSYPTLESKDLPLHADLCAPCLLLGIESNAVTAGRFGEHNNDMVKTVSKASDPKTTKVKGIAPTRKQAHVRKEPSSLLPWLTSLGGFTMMVRRHGCLDLESLLWVLGIIHSERYRAAFRWRL
jgi:hypothetical protein